MKFSILSTLSVVACIFSSFVVASPVASTSLAARDDATQTALVGHLTTLQTDLNTCHAKWKTTCASSCSTTHITSWSKECSVIILAAVTKCKATIPSGWKCPQPDIIVKILALIWIAIIDVMNFLCGKCGLLSGVLALLLVLLGSLIADIVAALQSLLNCLIPSIVGLVALLLTAVTGLLGTVLNCLILCVLPGLLKLLCL